MKHNIYDLLFPVLLKIYKQVDQQEKVELDTSYRMFLYHEIV